MRAHSTGSYWVYIVTNKRNGTLYIGVTGALHHRIWQHKAKEIDGFTKKYGLTVLVHFEEFRRADSAIAREKEIKGWLRRRKLALIEQNNPFWRDLGVGWYPPPDSSLRSE